MYRFCDCSSGFFCPGSDADDVSLQMMDAVATGLVNDRIVDLWRSIALGPLIPCPSGYFCPEGSTAAEPCPVMFYCPSQSAEPISCPALHYCPEQSDVPQRCPKGYFCPESSAEPIACPAGTRVSR